MSTIDTIRNATRGTNYEGRLFLVGGIPRDKALGFPLSEDVDIVLEGDALELARFLHQGGASTHYPVLYPRFGTAMLTIDEHQVELVTARAESYESTSRKPDVRKATLTDDAFRRDFTINTLMENLHTGELLDLTGRGFEDLRAGIIRTPLDGLETFYDDPLRMMRAIRFAVRFGFEIESATWTAIQQESHRLNLMGPEPPVVSAERIRDEFTKIVMASPGVQVLRCSGIGDRSNTPTSEHPSSQTPEHSNALVRGLNLLRESELLAQFFPELLAMAGVTQDSWHIYDVWDHTLAAMGCLNSEAPLELRLGLLLHDVGKPATRSVDERGIHFYEHQFVGAEIAAKALRRLKFTNEQIDDVVSLVKLHMRLGEAQPSWSDGAIRRLIRSTADYENWLFEIARCDHAAMSPTAPVTDLNALRERMDRLNAEMNAAKVESPLDGQEIMALLNISPGPVIGKAKEFLLNEVIEGRLAPDAKDAACGALLAWWRNHGKA